MKTTDIEWTTFSSNPLKYRNRDGKVVWACVKTSPGCAHCYAETIGLRYSSPARPSGPFVPANMRELTPFMDPAELKKIITAKTVDKVPTAGGKVFVGDMTDVFGEWVPFGLIDELFAAFALRPDMTFQVLTKRPQRMAEYLNNWPDGAARRVHVFAACLKMNSDNVAAAQKATGTWPLPNVWLGTSVENQRYADERIPHLLKCPAAVRFLSCEPLLGPVFLRHGVYDMGEAMGHRGTTLDGIHWCIVGGESGDEARVLEVEWIRSIVEQCNAAGVPTFVKQLGKVATVGTDAGRVQLSMADPKGGMPAEWPADLRVREFPKAGAA